MTRRVHWRVVRSNVDSLSLEDEEQQQQQYQHKLNQPHPQPYTVGGGGGAAAAAVVSLPRGRDCRRFDHATNRCTLSMIAALPGISGLFACSDVIFELSCVFVFNSQGGRFLVTTRLQPVMTSISVVTKLSSCFSYDITGSRRILKWICKARNHKQQGSERGPQSPCQSQYSS